MKRREFIRLVGGSAAWPVVGRAQQAKMPVIGFISVQGSVGNADEVNQLRNDLSEQGFTDGRNISIVTRENGSVEQRAEDLVRQRAAIIVTNGNVATRAAKDATGLIPIVFSIGGDPVALGLVGSLGHPGGNVTGVSGLTTTTEAKRFEILAELLPHAEEIAAFVDPNSATTAGKIADLQVASNSLGRRLRIFRVSNDREIDEAFEVVMHEGIAAIDVTSDSFFVGQSARIGALAAAKGIPAISAYRPFATAGGLLSYGSNTREQERLQSQYVAQILRGSKPGDMPVQQMSRIEMLLNLKAAKALGVSVPLPLLGRADEVIE